MLCRFFFFQAEDGIRDLVRSRGLGDVYKRQGLPPPPEVSPRRPGSVSTMVMMTKLGAATLNGMPVSYTHLTLPTSDLV